MILLSYKCITFLCVAIFISFQIQTISSSYESDVNNQFNLVSTEESFKAGVGNISRYNRQLDTDVERKFRISVNTIIRTGESRALGATYINETVLPSNRDCLTWCLETPNCNAAVFEDQSMHSCYLFDCGSPANFLCKFTSHNFFKSSVLRLTQHSYELSQWGNQVKHEKELLELQSNIASASTSTSPLPLDLKSMSELSPTLPTNAKPVNKCHHYQFMCLNTSECIAIYNVCDGIPQCPDASDESIDLKCPLKGAPSAASNQPPRPMPLPHHSENKGSVKVPAASVPKPTSSINSPQKPLNSNTYNKQKPVDRKEELRHKENDKTAWSDSMTEGQNSQPGYYHRLDAPITDDALGSPFVHKHSQFVAANDPHTQSLNRWSSDYDQYPQHSLSLEQQYNPYDGNYQRMDDQYIPNQLPPEYDSVKPYGGYRQEDIPYWSNQDTVQDGPYSAEELPQSLHGLSKQNGYHDKENNLYAQQLARTVEQYPEIKHRIMHKPLDTVPSIPQSQAPDTEEYKGRRYPVQRPQPYLAYDESLQRQYSNYPDIKSKGYEASQNIDDSMYSNDDLIRASIVSQLPSQDHHNHHEHGSEQHNYLHMERTTASHHVQETTEAAKESIRDDSLIIVKSTPHVKPVQRAVLDFKMSVTELYQSTTTHSQEANSAILALVLGIIITFLLIVLLACRMKTIRRRMSRKGRGLAHDADYLVNGMYL